MAWIRLDDDYMAHPKFTALSDRAFRLWHEGMAYCRKLMTDGLILAAALKRFRYATRPAIHELLTPPSDRTEPLWVADPQGVRVHDYLDWNPSHEEEAEERKAAKQRMRAFRGRARAPTVTPPVTPSVTANVTPHVTPLVTPHVPGEGQGTGSDPNRKETVTARSKWPIYTSDRFAVFDWQFEELSRVLGNHLNDFDLHGFFDALTQRSRAEGLVIPRADVWVWLQAQVTAEAKSRGLSMAGGVQKLSPEAEAAATLALLKRREAGDWSRP